MRGRISLKILTPTGAVLDIIPDAKDAQFLEEIKGPGTGMFQVPITYPRLAAHPNLLAKRNIVQVLVNGVVRGAWIIRNSHRVIVGTGEKAALYWEISGPGLRDWFHDAIVYPQTPGGGVLSGPITTQTDPGPPTNITSPVDPPGGVLPPGGGSVPGGSGVEPVGAGIVSYTSLSGSDLTAKAASTAKTNSISLPSGTFALHDFPYADYFTSNSKVGGYSAMVHNAGLLGSGADHTTIKLDQLSMNQTLIAEVQNVMDYANAGHTGATTNGLTMLRLDAPGVLLQDLTILGTTQGSYYNGLNLYYVSSPKLVRVRVLHIPGIDHVNPGETFGLSFLHCTNPTMTDVEVDGGNLGASGVGPNSSSGGTFTRVNSHNNPYSIGFALWEHSGGMVIQDCQAYGNRCSLNFERCTGTYSVNRFRFGSASDADIGGGNDQSASMMVVITDPLDQATGQPLTRQLKVRFFGNEIGSPSYIGKKNLKVIVGGVDKTSSMVKWLSVGNASA